MKNIIQNHIDKEIPYLKQKKLLLAVSGGLDSMVLLHLFQEMKCDIAIAHCNFQLRGMESFGDQKFVQDYAEANEIPIFVTQFDTEAFAKDYKFSTQVAARELRYNWFYELLETENFDYILTAHHADDNLETFLINLTRGTGLEGLTGIPVQNDRVIRPLLFLSRQEIENYAKANDIQWREDSSNASDKYVRNKIRHHLIPVLKELNPHFMSSFLKTEGYLQESLAMVEDAASMVYQQVAIEEGDQIRFKLKQLLQLPNYQAYLYQWLKEYGFTAWDDIYDLVASQSGKQVFAADYRLLKDRDSLILSSISNFEENLEFKVDKDNTEVKIPLNMIFSKASTISEASNKAIFVDENQLEFPLVIRKWKTGDVFHPLGMDGKSKKLSKFFKDEKLSLIEKENTWLLCSNNQIVWVIGLRADHRFKTLNATKNILKIELI
ncbi:tRNA lysidine(34) synthetase TilS [Flavobacterium gilvum]|uniref:tRNA(Ile)-lysidine synthase n=1 Tax=Flavobacterium gilvum TaxID=1492737 RepID=A0AAC9N436_9FLAO|nr:tRNA lysidine(34) synthetase TilS [Flavobacterium gilvum]AOW10015.1 tRNA lysidine(34) synthetase TilS [Flavobacterium gilvum]KFC60416.1 potassium-transporting ATPase subunit C [Flavobacterium gilvum]